jgi:hypothetical protein
MKKLTHIAFIVMMLLCIKCSSDNPLIDDENDSPEETTISDEGGLRQLREEILTMTSNKSCKNNSGSCKAIAFGSKACGGPASFLIYNSGNVNEAQLKAKVKKYNTLQVDHNIKAGLISDCMLLIEPAVSCINGTCEVVR